MRRLFVMLPALDEANAVAQVISGVPVEAFITPPNCLLIKPAQRLAMLATLPTKSAFTFCTKSSRLRSRSATLGFNFAAK